ncbi:MAG: hypothetical protein ACFFED_18400 [Candidatus Thorarchaeota archaeon]
MLNSKDEEEVSIMDITPYIQQLDLSDSIRRLQGNEEAEAQKRVVDFFFGEENGQCRRDVKWQYHDMIGVMLGQQGKPLSMKGGSIEINEIYVGEASLNRTYTIYDDSYLEFISDTLKHRLGDNCWLLPSNSLNRPSVFEGQLAAILHLVSHYWDDFYEFTLSSPDLKWMVDYNHHHSILVYGDKEASRAKFLLEDRRKWRERVLSISFHPKSK